MKRIAISDIHLSDFSEDILTPEGLPLRLGEIKKTFNFVIEQAKKLSISYIDVLGDIINDKSIIFTVAQDLFKEIIIKNSDMFFTLLSGNHDLSSTGKLQRSAISVFSGYKNVCCVTDEIVIDKNITMISYSDIFLEKIKECKSTDILLTHIGLNEAMMQSGLSKVDKIKLLDLKKFRLILSGHYHKPQFIQNENTKFYYVGGFTNHSWNDRNEVKRFLVYDTDTLEVQSIPMENQIQYKEYTIDDISTAKEILKEAEIQKNKGNYVRIRKNIKEDIETPHDILILEHKDIDVTNRGITVTQTLQEKLHKYMDIKEVKKEEQEDYIKILQKYNISE